MEAADFSHIYDQASQAAPSPKQSFLSQKSIRMGLVIIFLFFLAGIIFVANSSSPVKKTTVIIPITTPTPQVNYRHNPTPQPVTIQGTVICLPEASSSAAINPSCLLGIKTEYGNSYKIQNQSLTKTTATAGARVTFEGLITDSNTPGIAGDFLITNTASPPNQISSTSTPSPTPTPTVTPTPTQIPTNVSQTLNQAQNLNGQVVQISGLLVNGNIGTEACIYLNLCDHGILVIADTVDPNRNPQYDATVIINKDEKESDYKAGQNIVIQAKVIVNADATVTFEKIY